MHTELMADAYINAGRSPLWAPDAGTFVFAVLVKHHQQLHPKSTAVFPLKLQVSSHAASILMLVQKICLLSSPRNE